MVMISNSCNNIDVNNDDVRVNITSIFIAYVTRHFFVTLSRQFPPLSLPRTSSAAACRLGGGGASEVDGAKLIERGEKITIMDGDVMMLISRSHCIFVVSVE